MRWLLVSRFLKPPFSSSPPDALNSLVEVVSDSCSDGKNSLSASASMLGDGATPPAFPEPAEPTFAAGAAWPVDSLLGPWEQPAEDGTEQLSC